MVNSDTIIAYLYAKKREPCRMRKNRLLRKISVKTKTLFG